MSDSSMRQNVGIPSTDRQLMKESDKSGGVENTGRAGEKPDQVSFQFRGFPGILKIGIHIPSFRRRDSTHACGIVLDVLKNILEDVGSVRRRGKWRFGGVRKWRFKVGWGCGGKVVTG